MSLQRILGDGLMFPKPIQVGLAPAFATDVLIDATGEKAAFCGQVYFQERTGTKNISRVQFSFGTITKAGGSALTVSLQDLSIAAGPPIQPDETQDQTVAIANADASFTSNTWYRTGTLSASRTVNFGALLGIVIEYDGSGRLGADSVIIRSSGAIGNSASTSYHQRVNTLKTGGSWAALNSFPNIILEFDDGTFGTLAGSFGISAINTHTLNSGTAVSDEYALVVNFPFTCKVDGLWFIVSPSASTANFDMVLYSGTTPLQTVSVDAHEIVAASSRVIRVNIPETTLSINTDYYVALKPTTVNNLSIYSFDVNDANHWTAHEGGIAIQHTTRVDSGAWAAKTTTRRLMAGVCISSLDDGVSSGGSPIYSISE